ncbi:MAG: GNAT family N-acetyltransferase [Verrucomicrobiota bacterium]
MSHIPLAPFLLLTSASGILLSLDRMLHVGREAVAALPSGPDDRDDLLSEPKVTFDTSFGRLRVYSRADAISRSCWDENYPRQWKGLDFYQVVDKTMRHQFNMQYLVLEDEANEVKCVQPIFLVEQNLLEEIPSYLRWLRGLIKAIFPSLGKTKILMAGSPIAESHLGGRKGEERDVTRAALMEAVERYARHADVSLIVLKDLGAPYRGSLELFREHGYTRLESFPWVKLALDYKSFEDYMQRKLSQKMRRDLRLKFRKSAAAGLEFEVVADITQDSARIHELYLQVAKRSPVQFDVLTEEYFALIGRRLSEHTRFFLWRRNGEIVAFTFCVVEGDAIYDNDVGLDYLIAHDLHLYFVTRRDMIQWATEQGLTTYFCSPFTYDPKLHMKMDLVPMDLYVRHRSAPINLLLRLLAPRFAPARSEPLLRQFSNYSEL